MFDLQTTIKWVTELLKDPAAAAGAYRETKPVWRDSFMQITLPVYLAAYLASIIIATITGGSILLGAPTAGVIIFSILWALGWTFVIAYIFDFLAGTFDGTRNFDAAYAVVALAIIPSAIGTAIAPLPWIGWLLSIAASIYSLVLAYRFAPVFLDVPETARTKHFVFSIVAAIVVNMIVSIVVAAMLAPAIIQSAVNSRSAETTATGLFGDFERQANYADAASKDTYSPPTDGKVTQEQMRTYVDTIEKTAVLRQRLGGTLESLESEEPSASDLFAGVGDAMRMTMAEMEAVKSAGGNWAEHQWVETQIETARIQQDLQEATAHNVELFQEYREQIEQLE
jgi:hypothetical protein